MTKHGVVIAVVGGICALALAATTTPTSAAGGTAYLSHAGTGNASQAAPCNNIGVAVPTAGLNGEIICLDKGNYGGATITQSVTISCGDGLWEAPGGGVGVNTPAGSDVVIEGLVMDEVGFGGS